jgi:CMP-2-keto-3-deoxyoctulosonic acid synthetase
VKRDSKGHLTGNIRHAMQYVNTKYVLILQHDLPFIRNVNINNIINDMNNFPEMKHIRFNKRKNIKAHYDGINNLFGKEIKAIHYSYTRTPAWSDQNHICLTSYYKDIILKECKDGKFMEDQLYGVNKDEHAHLKYGNYLFGQLIIRQ